MRIFIQRPLSVQTHPSLRSHRLLRVRLSEPPDFEWWKHFARAIGENAHAAVHCGWPDEEEDATAIFDIRAQEPPGEDYRPVFEHVSKIIEATNARCDPFNRRP